MKKIFLLLSALTVLLYTSCIPQAEVDDVTLTVQDQGPVLFDNTASEKAIGISTNKSDWTAFPQASWIEAIPSDSQLLIRVEDNNSPMERRGKVLILAGGKTGEVEVVQSGSSIIVNAYPQELRVSQWQGTYEFDIDSNVKDWSVTSDQEWVTVEAKPWRGQLVVNVTENVERADRTATLTVVAENGKVTKDLVFTQSGILYYILPYLDFAHGIRNNVNEFEVARRSQMVYNMSKWYDFKTVSPVFNKISYIYEGDQLVKIEEYISDVNKYLAPESESLNEYIDYMVSEGFAVSGGNSLFNEEIGVLASIHNDTFFNPHVLFTHIPKQPKPYPTWDAFPYGFIKWGASKEEIIEYEKANGGVYDPYDPDFENPEYEVHFINFKIENNPEIAFRSYYVTYDSDTKKTQLIDARQEWFDINKCYWMSGGRKFLTNEFKALMEKEGFVYQGVKGEKEFDTFLNIKKGLGVLVRMVQYIDSPNPVVEIGIVPVDSGEAGQEKAFYPSELTGTSSKYKVEKRAYNTVQF